MIVSFRASAGKGEAYEDTKESNRKLVKAEKKIRKDLPNTQEAGKGHCVPSYIRRGQEGTVRTM